MAAPKGNKYPEKWDKKTVENILLEMIAFLKADRVILKANQRHEPVHYLEDVLLEFDLYKNIWQYWKHRFSPDNESPVKDGNEVLRLINIVETYVQNNLLKFGEKQRNQTIPALVLKTHYGYVDRIESSNKNENNNNNSPQKITIDWEDKEVK